MRNADPAYTTRRGRADDTIARAAAGRGASRWFRCRASSHLPPPHRRPRRRALTLSRPRASLAQGARRPTTVARLHERVTPSLKLGSARRGSPAPLPRSASPRRARTVAPGPPGNRHETGVDLHPTVFPDQRVSRSTGSTSPAILFPSVELRTTSWAASALISTVEPACPGRRRRRRRPGTGVHGANLAGPDSAQGLVFGARAAQAMLADDLPLSTPPEGQPAARTPGSTSRRSTSRKADRRFAGRPGGATPVLDVIDSISSKASACQQDRAMGLKRLVRQGKGSPAVSAKRWPWAAWRTPSCTPHSRAPRVAGLTSATIFPSTTTPTSASTPSLGATAKYALKSGSNALRLRTSPGPNCLSQACSPAPFLTDTVSGGSSDGQPHHVARPTLVTGT